MALLRKVSCDPIGVVAEVAIKSAHGERRGARITMFGADDATLEFYAPVYIDSLRVPGIGCHIRFRRIRLPMVTIRKIWFISLERVRMLSEDSETIEICGTYDGNRVFVTVPAHTLRKGALNVLEA